MMKRNESPRFSCCFVPLGNAFISLMVSFSIGYFICGFDIPHVGFDLAVVTSGIVTHINLHEAFKRLNERPQV